MKKNYAFCLLFLMATCLVYSQTITYSGNAPVIGDDFYLSNNAEMLDPGSAGPNQTWDYSDFNVTSTSQATIMAPGSTPFESDFPECNQVFHFDGTSTYIYYALTQNEMVHYGQGFDVNPPQIIYYSDPRKEIEYPFSFNNSFTDTWYTSYEYEGMTTHRSGTYVITADAWGSLTTPEDTYPSVLRTTGYNSQIDSIWMDGIFVYATASLFTNHSWHTASSHTPVMAITIIETDLGTSYASHYTTSSQHVINPVAGITSLQVSPNPAKDHLQISFEAEENINIQISIIDITGREIIKDEYDSNKAGDQHTTISLDKIEAGLYFVKISNGNKTLSKKIIVR